MYEAYYRLRAKPFQLSPDPSFFYGSKGHKRAMSYLEYGLHQGEGFIVVTGEVGAGKTALVRHLFKKIAGRKSGCRAIGEYSVRRRRYVAHGRSRIRIAPRGK